jgi:hypothetical protein
MRNEEGTYMTTAQTIVLVHIQGNGSIEYLIQHGTGARVFVVDERAPHDRVYEMTLQAPIEAIQAVLGDDPIGSRADSRHKAIEHRVLGVPFEVVR